MTTAQVSHGQEPQTITLAGGCFWCLEAVYTRVRGVLSVQSGYANGHLAHPSYEQVCSGSTGHAEVVQIGFDPEQVSLRELLEVFFAIHDPTSLNRQGGDVGTQYRSGIYYSDAAHETLARQMLRDIEQEGEFGAPLVTELRPLESFWPAEEHHGNYFARNPGQGYCRMVVAPKVEKFRKTFARLLQAGA